MGVRLELFPKTDTRTLNKQQRDHRWQTHNWDKP